VVLGDTSNSDSVLKYAMDADLITHETTYDESLQEKATGVGHSTSRYNE
jgi:ribonuclease BN (tRNA processing enzyme)